MKTFYNEIKNCSVQIRFIFAQSNFLSLHLVFINSNINYFNFNIKNINFNIDFLNILYYIYFNRKEVRRCKKLSVVVRYVMKKCM